MTHAHEALQLSAVMMIYALGCCFIFLGRRVLEGMSYTPSGLTMFLFGGYLIVKAIKHT